jgi:hypothetical protein
VRARGLVDPPEASGYANHAAGGNTLRTGGGEMKTSRRQIVNREFRAYVRAVVSDAGVDCGKQAAAHRSSALSRGFRNLVARVFEFLEANGPYYCELRPMRSVRSALEKCCKPKEVIGFHGLL